MITLKMKVIDLLVNISNGKEVPEKIKWEDTIYVYSKYDKDYLEFPISVDEYKGLFNMKDSILTQFLNEEVEIIEEEPKEETTYILEVVWIEQGWHSGGADYEFDTLEEAEKWIKDTEKHDECGFMYKIYIKNMIKKGIIDK